MGCRHCGYIGSNRDRAISTETAADWTAQLCEYGIPLIIITGGEPFGALTVLRRVVLTAHEAGTPSGVFTSSFWATTRDVSERVLRSLPGLSHLYLSSDVYHQERVPYENIHNVIETAADLGIEDITICITYSNEEELRSVKANYSHYGDLIRFYEERVIPTDFIGDVLERQDGLLDMRPANFQQTCWIDTPIVNPTGDVFACHVGKAGAHGSMRESPYWLGNMNETDFATIMRIAKRNRTYQYLRTHGPCGVAEAVQEHAKDMSKKPLFTGGCHMCFSTLSTTHGKESMEAHLEKSQTMLSINTRLSLLRGEPPIDWN